MRNLLQEADLEKPIPRCLLLASQRGSQFNRKLVYAKLAIA